MTGDGVVARRYARALFAVARERGSEALVEEQLKVLVDAMALHVELKQIILHPNIEASAKTELLQRIFNGELNESLLQTVRLLLERGRGSMLPELYRTFVQVSNEALGRADALVYSPLELPAGELQEIAAKFSEISSKTIRAQTVVDPSLLGGIRVRIGDRLYDGSLSGKLERLQKSLAESKAI